MRVLLTGGGGASAHAWMQVAGARHELFFTDMRDDCPDWLLSERWCQVPPASDIGYVEAIRQCCEEHDIELIVPGIDEELLRLSEASATLPRLLLPDYRTIAIHLDKLTSFDALSEFETIPDTASADTPWDQWPAILKPRCGRGSRDVYLVQGPDEVEAYVSLRKRPAHDWVLQEYLDGLEYSVTLVADASGLLRAVVPVRTYDKRGITLRGEINLSPQVIDFGARIHQVCSSPGIINIQGMLVGKEFWPFEVNPRVSTTTPLAWHALGCDLFSLAMTSHGEMLPLQPSGIRRHWHTVMR